MFTLKIITMKKNNEVQVLKNENKGLAVQNNDISEPTTNLIKGLSSKDMGMCLLSIRKKASYVFKNGQLDFSTLLSSETTQLSKVKRVYGDEVLATIIYRLIDDMNANFNVSRGLTNAQVYQLSIDIVEELWDHRLEEILGFCHAMKKGLYIKIYERIDASIFWEAWEKYQIDRSDHLHRNHLNLKGSTFKEDRGKGSEDRLGNLVSGFSAIRSSTERAVKPDGYKPPKKI